MKKLINRFFIASILFSSIVILFSCSKNDGNSNTRVPANFTWPNFTWTYNGSTYNADLDTAYTQGLGLAPFYIIAIKGTNFITSHTQLISFNLTSFNTGNFSIAPGSNIMHYIDVLGYDHSGVSGTLSITSNTNNLMSGNFTAIIAGPSGNEPISGSFTNIPVKP